MNNSKNSQKSTKKRDEKVAQSLKYSDFILHEQELLQIEQQYLQQQQEN